MKRGQQSNASATWWTSVCAMHTPYLAPLADVQLYDSGLTAPPLPKVLKRLQAMATGDSQTDLAWSGQTAHQVLFNYKQTVIEPCRQAWILMDEQHYGNAPYAMPG